eukprot:scaffold4973_cov135-Cylindrotheca_fusiformis.AAC.29
MKPASESSDNEIGHPPSSDSDGSADDWFEVLTVSSHSASPRAQNSPKSTAMARRGTKPQNNSGKDQSPRTVFSPRRPKNLNAVKKARQQQQLRTTLDDAMLEKNAPPTFVRTSAPGSSAHGSESTKEDLQQSLSEVSIEFPSMTFSDNDDSPRRKKTGLKKKKSPSKKVTDMFEDSQENLFHSGSDGGGGNDHVSSKVVNSDKVAAAQITQALHEQEEATFKPSPAKEEIPGDRRRGRSKTKITIKRLQGQSTARVNMFGEISDLSLDRGSPSVQKRAVAKQRLKQQAWYNDLKLKFSDDEDEEEHKQKQQQRRENRSKATKGAPKKFGSTGAIDTRKSHGSANLQELSEDDVKVTRRIFPRNHKIRIKRRGSKKQDFDTQIGQIASPGGSSEGADSALRKEERASAQKDKVPRRAGSIGRINDKLRGRSRSSGAKASITAKTAKNIDAHLAQLTSVAAESPSSRRASQDDTARRHKTIRAPSKASGRRSKSPGRLSSAIRQQDEQKSESKLRRAERENTQKANPRRFGSTGAINERSGSRFRREERERSRKVSPRRVGSTGAINDRSRQKIGSSSEFENLDLDDVPSPKIMKQRKKSRSRSGDPRKRDDELQKDAKKNRTRNSTGSFDSERVASTPSTPKTPGGSKRRRRTVILMEKLREGLSSKGGTKKGSLDPPIDS